MGVYRCNIEPSRNVVADSAYNGVGLLAGREGECFGVGIILTPKDARAMAAELVKLADEIEGK